MTEPKILNLRTPKPTELLFEFTTRAKADAPDTFVCLAYDCSGVDSYYTTMTSNAFMGTTIEDFRILQYHDASSDPVGKPIALNFTDRGLEVEFVFAETARAQELKTLVEGGFLRAVSVGFTPLQGFEREDGVFVFTKCKLHELSLVNVPSSAGALIKNGLSFVRDIFGIAPDDSEATTDTSSACCPGCDGSCGVVGCDTCDSVLNGDSTDPDSDGDSDTDEGDGQTIEINLVINAENDKVQQPAVTVIDRSSRARRAGRTSHN